MEIKHLTSKIVLSKSRLYIDDILAISELMSEENRTLVFKFTCNDIEYSMAELKDIENVPELGLNNTLDANLSCSDENGVFIETDFKHITVTKKIHTRRD